MKTKPENMRLDSEERWFEDNSNNFIPADAKMREKLIQAAKLNTAKTERMNIRMSKTDMESLKLAASREGLPYQSLVASILHKYTAGLLVDIQEVQKFLQS